MSSDPDPRDVHIVQWPPTSWLDPVDITRTGLKTFLAGLFGSFADKREVVAALYPHDDHVDDPTFNYSDRKEVWFDIISDTGDGWNPTYSIAYLVGKNSLDVLPPLDGGEPANGLTRGDFTILGGDQVYPVASPEQYRERMEGPFYSARATSVDPANRTPVYALPGNHDWYDGLTSFIRLFCQKDRWVGQWTAMQTRSYFAIQLPHRWWIWGLDVQLESNVDPAQVRYFKHYAKFLRAGDRVILVTPEPTWIEVGRPTWVPRWQRALAWFGCRKLPAPKAPKRVRQSYRNMTFLEDTITAAGATIPVRIAGDLHHYARYEGDDGSTQLITCGGGGAFLHGTFGLPQTLDLTAPPIKQRFHLVQTTPTPEQSKRMRWPVLWRLLFQNPWFAVAVGGIYLAYSWFLQSASEALDTLPWDEATLLDYFRTGKCISWDSWNLFRAGWWNFFWEINSCSKVFWAWKDIVARNPLLFFFTLAIVLGCLKFALASRRNGISSVAVTGTAVVGFLHGVAHIVLALVLIKVAAFWEPGLAFLAHPTVLVLGAIPGTLLVAIYLLLAHLIVGAHDQEVLSTQAIEHHKCFARFHVTEGVLTIYPIGLERVCTEWNVAPRVETTAVKQRCFPRRRCEYDLKVPHGTERIFEPAEPLAPRLMEKPIEVLAGSPLSVTPKAPESAHAAAGPSSRRT